jgi:hypothetical protein
MAVEAKAAVNLTKPVFKGEHQELLEEFYSVFRKLWDEHYTSPVFAGDEMIFALGGNGMLRWSRIWGLKLWLRSRRKGCDRFAAECGAWRSCDREGRFS